jgi:hypothetical protein
MWETEYTMVMSPMLLFNQIRQVLSTDDVAILIQAKLHTAKKEDAKILLDMNMINIEWILNYGPLKKLQLFRENAFWKP